MERNINMDTVEDQVYQIIRDDINMQVLKPGCRINENKIAEALKVSRSPVREAIKRLKGDGLVVTIPNRGAFVRKMTAQEIQDMYNARIMFEVYSVENIVYLPEPKQKDKLSDIFSKMQTAYEKKEIADYLHLDRELHMEIVSLCSNPYILELYDKLNWQINIFRTKYGWDDNYFNIIHSEHMELKSYLLSNSFPAVAAMLPPHIRRGAWFITRNM